ncbi:MAG: hypothetical protein IT449_12670 [Phycisphaerales bacterium]|nr:hypothetical protein [Phycisphaerales bacterium]
MTTEERLAELDLMVTKHQEFVIKAKRKLLTLVTLSVLLLLIAAASIVGVVPAMAQAQKKDNVHEVRASRIVLEDGAGPCRAVLEMDKSELQLSLFTEKDKLTTRVRIGPGGTLRVFGDAGADPKQALASFEPYRHGHALALFDYNGQLRATLSGDWVEPRLEFFDKTGKVRALLRVEPNGDPKAELLGPSGTAV